VPFPLVDGIDADLILMALDELTVKALKLCSRCPRVGYCGKECQKKDWKNHKAACAEVSRATDSDELTALTSQSTYRANQLLKYLIDDPTKLMPTLLSSAYRLSDPESTLAETHILTLTYLVNFARQHPEDQVEFYSSSLLSEADLLESRLREARASRGQPEKVEEDVRTMLFKRARLERTGRLDMALSSLYSDEVLQEWKVTHLADSSCACEEEIMPQGSQPISEKPFLT
jgi:hypothetical protein